jgi:YD repeat-containing protein
VDPLGHIVSHAYGALNRETQTIEAYGVSGVQRTATMVYDAADNLISETTGQSSTSSYAHPVTTSHAYDALNRETKTIAGYGTSVAETTTMVYDAVGNLLSETTGQSTTSSYAHVQTTSFGYDALYRQTATIEAYGTSLQRTSTVVYDSADNVLQSIDAANFTTTATYDALNREVTEQTPAGGTSAPREVLELRPDGEHPVRIEIVNVANIRLRMRQSHPAAGLATMTDNIAPGRGTSDLTVAE